MSSNPLPHIHTRWEDPRSLEMHSRDIFILTCQKLHSHL